MEKYRKNLKTIVLFLAPALMIYILLAAVPIVQSIYFSFFDWPGIQGIPLNFVGLQNFVKLLQNANFYKALLNSCEFIVLGILLQLPVGYGLALALSNYCKGYRFFKSSFFLPTILPLTATSLVWQFIYGANQSGILNFILYHIGLGGLSTAWLINSKTALVCVIVTNAWAGFGYHMTLGFAAITGLPGDVIEAAEIDGAVGLKKVAYIIIPMISETIKTSVVMIVVGSVQIFDIVYIMTDGGPNGLTNTLATLLYNEAFKYNHYGSGSAVSAAIFVISIILTLISLKLLNRRPAEG